MASIEPSYLQVQNRRMRTYSEVIRLDGIVPKDRNQTVTEHLAEASNRIQRVVFALIIVATIWAFLIEDIFSWWLSNIPLAEGAGTLTIYSPYSWLDTRWTAVGLLAIWTIMPWLSVEFWWFAKPGLLKHERKWLSSMISSSILFGSLIIIIGWGWGFPKLVGIAQVSSSIDGVGLQYDVVSLFQMALSLSWFVLIMFILSLSLTFARALGLIGDDPLDSFRIRLHFVSIVMLYIVTPPAFQGLFLLAVISLVFISEFIANLYPFSSKSRERSASTVFDLDGGERRVVLIDCACEGSCARINQKHLSSSVGVMIAQALCLQPLEVEYLSDRVAKENLTDVVISGCDGAPIPGDLKKSLLSLGCDYSGLNRLSNKLNSESASQDIIEFADILDLSRASRPWSKDAQGRAQKKVIDEKSPKEFSFISSNNGQQPWGIRLVDNEIWLHSGELIDSDLEIRFIE